MPICGQMVRRLCYPRINPPGHREWLLRDRGLNLMPISPENKARYPKDWKLRSRFVRFSRAKNRCEWCGAENYKPHPVTGSKVILTCAHVYDHRPEAASLLNLASLCQKCHLGHDRAMHQQNRRLNRERIARESGQMSLPNSPRSPDTADPEGQNGLNVCPGDKCTPKTTSST